MMLSLLTAGLAALTAAAPIMQNGQMTQENTVEGSMAMMNAENEEAVKGWYSRYDGYGYVDSTSAFVVAMSLVLMLDGTRRYGTYGKYPDDGKSMETESMDVGMTMKNMETMEAAENMNINMETGMETKIAGNMAMTADTNMNTAENANMGMTETMNTNMKRTQFNYKSYK